MQYPIEKYVPGIGRQFFIHPDHVSDTADYDASKYIPGLGISVYVPQYCINELGGAEKYIPGLGTQFFIHPKHVIDTDYREPVEEPEEPIED